MSIAVNVESKTHEISAALYSGTLLTLNKYEIVSKDFLFFPSNSRVSGVDENKREIDEKRK